MYARIRGTSAVVLVVAAVVAMATACGDRKEIEVVGDDPRLFVHTSQLPAYPDMNHPGTLEYNPDDRCMYLRTERGRAAIVWPRGTRPVVENGVRGADVPGIGVVLDGAGMSIAGIEITAGDNVDPLAGPVDDLDVLGGCLPQGARIVVIDHL